jgi:alkylation response protein AidB-like acyl-CoA dehydrogenase/flavin-dependent dehydrogenase/ferredoxin-like protein FixX
MTSSNYDVIVVGAGAAGLTAAIGLARAGFTVAAVEAAAYPGAENWSGCVFFGENLTDPAVLGPDGVEALAWERRLVERGFFATDGHSLMGMTYRDPEAFRQCYTVLRPIYDHHLAQVALRNGVALLCGTTAESLIRDGERVIGVCTQRGALYADLIFLAEGDASHLVTREGYERSNDPRDAPKFLQGIKQVIELPPGAIEDRFGVGPLDGVAYEMLLRNGTLRGRSVRLNMGGFVYTNRQSLSIGLVLPADNLREHFGGDPNLLLEWFENLAVLRPWLREGRRGTFGAKLIRGGGARDIPTLIDHGLAVGGAASAIGIDFPYPNFTGPATAMGLLLTRAACQIRAEHGRFTREDLERHYLEPLRQTHYWRDVEFLRRWPGYVKRTSAFFGRDLDLLLGSAYVWTRPKRWLLTKWTNWMRLVRQVAGPRHWHELQADVRQLVRALRLSEVVSRPALGKLLLDGTLNALRDLCGRPRSHLPAAGTIRLHYQVAGGAEPSGPSPAGLRRWFRRFSPVLASAARLIYQNDERPLEEKLAGAVRLLIRQVNLFDAFALMSLGLVAALSSGALVVWQKFLGLIRRRRPGAAPKGLYPRYASAARQATDLTPWVTPAAQHWESRLAHLAYQTVKSSHIHLVWPKSLEDKNAVAQKGLWHVCPARVYEARVSPLDQLQLVVNYENCIKCETCWRTSDLVDWGRDGRHTFIYAVSSPAVTRLLDAVHTVGFARPAVPRKLDVWEETARPPAGRLLAETFGSSNGQVAGEVSELTGLLGKLERKLVEFDAALGEEPRTVDRPRAEYLEMLARYAQRLAARVVDVLRGGALAESPQGGVVTVQQRLLQLATVLANRADERARRTWNQQFAWAASDGRQLRFHHLAGLRRLLDSFGVSASTLRAEAGSSVPREVGPEPDPTRTWLRAEDHASAVAEKLAHWTQRLDAVFPPLAWRELEQGKPLEPAQDAVLRDLLADIPALDPAHLGATLHPPLRKALLAELGRRDPSLAYRAASHLWARDLARLATSSAALGQAARRWARGDEWAAFAVVENAEFTGRGWQGEALFLPAQVAQALLLLVGDQLVIVPVNRGDPSAGLAIERLTSLGLRGAGLAMVRLQDWPLPEPRVAVDHDRIVRVWHTLSAADLTSIAVGMADRLCERAVAHASSRVQFPGLFHDETARDTIGKFGAVKKMLAEMAARRYLLETLDQVLSPTDFSAASVAWAGVIKTIASEVLGTAPGSLTYNAGQIFGGTGYSEDDILAKYYRDAAAWRFLGQPNADIYGQLGSDLLQTWRADGQRLTALPGEALLFEQVAQRKALQTELDAIRFARSRLRGLVNDWKALSNKSARPSDPAAAPGRETDRPGPPLPSDQAEAAEAVVRQNAVLFASKALLLRTHARLEHGLSAELEIALLRVWLEGAGASLGGFEAWVRRWLAPRATYGGRPLLGPDAGPPVTSYADYLAAPGPYESGDFLGTPIDLQAPRLVPEMVESDPHLAERDHQLRKLLAGYFGPPREGLPYERYIERQHRPDPADLDFCRRHGFFRMPIPRELGGEGRPKIDYYLLTTHTQRLADVALALTIQVNTSIGTTPILLARDKDLPRAQKDLAAFLKDAGLQTEITTCLQHLLAESAFAGPAGIERAYRELGQRLDTALWARPVLKTLAHPFGEAWRQAGQAVQAFDAPGLRAALERAAQAWRQVCQNAAGFQEELGRRLRACDLFLRWIAAGQISAFALTEPSAGSDSARVGTRAVPRSVVVEEEADGVLRFLPPGKMEPRYLLDADRLEFRPDGVVYRWSDLEAPSPVRFENYDYETDEASRTRFYNHGGRHVAFTDVAQLRTRDGKRWYDYWELNGAKMWITNGRMAGVFCLYAKTAEGVTGFLVDRHAEDLVVGKDEAKMGQCGSPTNELALQGVRVPRENVLGLEGRGQVNALETLNVGRAGLAMSAMAPMAGLVEQSRDFAQAAYGDVPDWVVWRLQRMEEARFIAEAVAYEIVGRFEHPQTKSVRLESAIAKMLNSELLHEVIEFAEDIHGLASQTQQHLVEKRKRDARVLNIYEGTNEVQRFFILKDLAAEVAPRWQTSVEAAVPKHLSQEVLELEALKVDFRTAFTAAREVFGQGLWQNPNLQANCFLLAEAAAWLKAADSTLGRLAWLDRQPREDEESAPPESVELARRALSRCSGAVQDRLRRFQEELAHLRRGYYAVEVRAADLLFQQGDQPAKPEPPHSRITRPLSVLVIVEPTVAAMPHPHVAGGRLLEAHWTLSPADRSALETALRLRDQAAAPVTVQVAAVGPRGAAQALREPLSLGVDRARLVVSEMEAVAPDSAAAALAGVLKSSLPVDLILGGDRGEGVASVVAQLTVALLGVPYLGRVAQLAVQATFTEAEVILRGENRLGPRVRSLPVAVVVEAGPPLRPFSVQGYLAGLAKNVEAERWPWKAIPQSLSFVETTPAAAVPDAEPLIGPLTPAEAAGRVLQEMGLDSAPGSAVLPYDGPIEDGLPTARLDDCALAVVASDGEGRLQASAGAAVRATEALAQAEGLAAAILLLVPPRDAAQRQALARLPGGSFQTVVLLCSEGVVSTPEVRGPLLAESWPSLAATPRAVVGEPWTEPALAMLSAQSGQTRTVALRVRRLAWKEDQIILEMGHGGAGLSSRQTTACEPNTTSWISLTAEAEVETPPQKQGIPVEPPRRVHRWTPRLERFLGQAEIQRLLAEVKQELGVVRLADAEFLIDVGFGVGNRDGFEAVIEPLERALRELGVTSLAVGGSRKVTEELHLLPADRQIGQSGVSVQPRVLLAIGISGAPQHLQYIGPRATILAFNRDPEAPIMTLNQRQPRPRVFPVVGDLFETVPQLIAAIKREQAGESEGAAEPERAATAGQG